MYRSILHNQGQLNYRIEGSASKCLLVLHGFLEDGRIFDFLFPAFADVCTVISVDLPGFGKSQDTHTDSIDAMADAVLAVLQEESIDEVYACGHSMGGYVALSLADKFPLRGLMLLNSSPFPDDGKRKQVREQAIELCKRKKNLYIKQSLNSLFYGGGKNVFQAQIKSLYNAASQLDEENIISALRAMKNRKDKSSSYAKANYRKLIFHGKHDPLISAYSLKKYAEKHEIPWHESDQSGHMAWIESPDEVLEKVKCLISP